MSDENTEGRTEKIVLRVSREEKATVKQLAKWSNRSVSNHIRHLLGLPEERIGRPKKPAQ